MKRVMERMKEEQTTCDWLITSLGPLSGGVLVGKAINGGDRAVDAA